MKVLVIGSGGREHAIIDKLSASPFVDKIYAAPGNDGMAKQAELVAIGDTDVDALVAFALDKNIDLTVVGPEVSLAAGVVDAFKAKGLRIFGPDKKAARIESSKEYAKELMKKYHIPTAKFQSFSDYDEALAYVREKGAPIVIKYDGLAAGKGVVVALTLSEAEAALKDMLVDDKYGKDKVVIEEYCSTTFKVTLRLNLSKVNGAFRCQFLIFVINISVTFTLLIRFLSIEDIIHSLIGLTFYLILYLLLYFFYGFLT